MHFYAATVLSSARNIPQQVKECNAPWVCSSCGWHLHQQQCPSSAKTCDRGVRQTAEGACAVHMRRPSTGFIRPGLGDVLQAPCEPLQKKNIPSKQTKGHGGANFESCVCAVACPWHDARFAEARGAPRSRRWPWRSGPRASSRSPPTARRR